MIYIYIYNTVMDIFIDLNLLAHNLYTFTFFSQDTTSVTQKILSDTIREC